MLLLAAALFALVWPVIGPLDDHHFAERTHTHEHIYLNGRPVPHGHAYQNGLRHLHPAASQTSDETGALRTGDIIYLTPATAAPMLAVLSAPYHTAPEALRPPAPRAQDANPLARSAAPSPMPDGINVPPPEPPPIA